MVDANDVERRALDAASDAGGAYIEAQRTADFRRWNAEQWAGLVEAIVTGYVDSIIKAQLDAGEALGKVMAP